MSQIFSDGDAVANAIITTVGKRIVLGLPLGLGKANHIVNALFARAAADPSIHLTIFTALTLEKPRPKNELEARFINPVIDRLFGGFPELAYAQALHQLLAEGVNVVAQLVAKRVVGGRVRYRLGGNTDITIDLLKVLHAGLAA